MLFQPKTNKPFENCVVVSSLIFLLNDQLEKCVCEFMRLNDLALQSCNEYKINNMLKHYNKMLDIIHYLEPASEFLTRYHNPPQFYKAMFTEAAKPSKELFENFQKLYNSTKECN